MQHASIESQIAQLRSQRSELMAQPSGTPEQNFALDLKIIDIDTLLSELQDQSERDQAWAFKG